MNDKPVDRRVRKTRKLLAQGLAKLLERKNIKDVTVRELTDLCDLNRGTFYLHYRDIYDLQSQIEQELFEGVNKIFDQYTPASMRDNPYLMLLPLMEYLSQNQEIVTMLLSKNGDLAFVEELGNTIRGKCLHMVMELYRDRNADTQRFEYFAAYLVNGCVGVVRYWFASGMNEQPSQIAGLLEQLMLLGSPQFLDPQNDLV